MTTSSHPSALQTLAAQAANPLSPVPAPTTKIPEITYVYEGREVYLTGRIAARIASEGTSRAKKEELHEIANVTPELQGSQTAWVKISQLFKVEK